MAPLPDVPSKAMALGVGIFAAFGGFLFGYDTGYISGVKAMPYFIEHYGDLQPDGSREISTSTDSLITSILSAGTFFGALSAGPVLTILGRRIGLGIYLLLFAAGVAMQTAAYDVPLFSVGRVFAGLGVGGVSVGVPVYQSEVVPKAWRGGVVSAYQLFVTLGLLIAAIIVNATKDMTSGAAWQIPIGVQFVWFAILLAGLFVLPESPRWLITKGHDEKARRSLARLFRLPVESDYVASEYADIAANIHAEREIGTASYAELLFRPTASRLRLRVWTGIVLQSLQQLSGINFIFYYGTTFFRNSGIENPFLITIATNVVNVGMTIPGIWAVDKLGRRKTMIYGAAGMAVCQLIVAATGTAIGNGNPAGQKVLVAFVCLFIAHFAAIWGPYAWVITAEILPNASRAKGVSITTGAQWLWNFGIGYATPYLVDTGAGRAGLGAKVFWIWGGCCFVAIAFAFFFIPETKGLSLEQIDILYRNSSIIGSNAYRKRILAENMADNDKEAYFAAAQEKNHATTGHHEHARRDLREDVEKATSTNSFITSILSGGTFFGALSAGPILTLLGRHVGLGIYLLLFAAGVAMQTAAYDVPLFSVGRVFAGLGVGGVSVGVPVYQSEVVPKAWRGGVVSAYQLFVTLVLPTASRAKGVFVTAGAEWLWSLGA
ncbi:hypothetical protein JCM10207_005645 [Rhodosporidiobolus poonsookiae]